jgi:hypothetical protein
MSNRYNELDPVSSKNVLQQASVEAERKAIALSTDPAIADRITYINTRAPWIPAATQLALAKSYASDAAIDKAADLNSRELLQNGEEHYSKLSTPGRQYKVTPSVIEARKQIGQGKKPDMNILDKSYEQLKQASRIALSVGASTVEGFANLATLDPLFGMADSPSFDPVKQVLNPFYSLGKKFEGKNQNLRTAANSLSLYQLLTDWDDQGEGFFISEELQSRQIENARSFRGTYGGSAFTTGRGAASTVFTPGTWQYNAFSGFIDFGIALAIPDANKYVVTGVKSLNYTTRALSAAKKGEDFIDSYNLAKGVVPLVSQADATQFRNALLQEGGLDKSLTGMSMDMQKWNRFMDTNPVAIRTVDAIIGTKSPVEIMKRFKNKLKPEDAVALAKADSVDAVKKVLVRKYAIGNETLSTSIYDINPTIASNPGQFIVQRTPLSRSRLLMQIPDRDIVINGDDMQRTSSIMNMIRSVENAGGTAEDVEELGKIAFKNFGATSSADDQRDAYKVYEKTIEIILKRNGVKDEVIEKIFERPRNDMMKFRSTMLDRAGNATDNGYMQVYANMMRRYFPTAFKNQMLETVAETGTDGFQFARPMQLSELFDRVQTLPNARELRRLTMNPLMRENLEFVFGTIPKGKLSKALTSKVRRMDITTYADEARVGEIQKELDALTRKPKRSNLDNLKINKLDEEMDSLTNTKKQFVYTGEASMPIAFMDTVQNLIWKPLQLATIGYAIRNSIDAQVRMAMGGASGFLNHPGEYLTLLLGETKASNRMLKLAKKAGLNTMERSILGEALTAKHDEYVDVLRKDHSDLLGLDSRKQGLGVSSGAMHMHRTNNWISVSKATSEENYVTGIVHQIRLVHSDDLQRFVAKARVLGYSEQELMDGLLKIAKEQRNFDNIDGIYRRGPSFRDGEQEVFGPARSLRNLKGKDLDDFLSEVHLRPIPIANVDNISGGFDDVTFMMAFDRVPMFDKRTVVPIRLLQPTKAGQDFEPGSLVKISQVENGETVVRDGIISRIDEATGDATVIPVHDGPASASMMGHKTARRIVKRLPLYDEATGGKGLPREVYVEQIMNADKGVRDSWFNDVQAGLDKYTDLLFSELYGKRWVKTTERSPVFRKFYYDSISENMSRLSSQEAEELIGSLSRLSSKAGFGGDIGKYIGSQETYANLKMVAKNTSNTGTVTVSELDDYARLVALEKVKGLLYDASSRSNLEDILRIVMPFAPAWREILGTYTTRMIEDPSIATRFGRYVNTAINSDPDGDGRGFFYKDSTSGDMYFKFPAILGLPNALALTGTDAFFKAPVKQLSQGMSWIPGLGPFAQIPASFLLRNTPDTSATVQVLLPYGKVKPSETLSSLNPLPSVLTKAGDVAASYFTDRQDQMNTTFANTYIDVWRAKSASGDYDIATESGQKKLVDDSLRDARTISWLRLFQAFLGPTSPTVGYKVKVKKDNQDVDVYVDQMVNIFGKMQEENYDTAVTRFLNVFGEEMALYVGSKTKSEVPGLEGSREFGEWEFANTDVLDEYKRTGAYFAPKGSELNFDVWRRQLDQGKRTKLKDSEILSLAQNRVGSAKFRQARKLFGQSPTAQQSAQLDAYRAQLNKQYPGFPRFSLFTVGQFPNDIEELENAVKDPRLSSSAITADLKDYLDTRKKYLNSLGVKTFESKKSSFARTAVYNLGLRLSEENPEFARIWERLLSQEVED